MVEQSSRVRRILSTVAYLSVLVSIALTVGAYDWKGLGVPKPPWYFVTPMLSGFLGAAAAFAAHRPILGLIVGACGFLALPIAFYIVTRLGGP